jgi:hypothetical protein
MNTNPKTKNFQRTPAEGGGWERTKPIREPTKVPAVVKGEPKPSSHGDGDGGEREGAETAKSERARRVRERGTEGVRRE